MPARLPELMDCPGGAYITRDRRVVCFYWPWENQPKGHLQDNGRAMSIIEAQKVREWGLKSRKGRAPR